MSNIVKMLHGSRVYGTVTTSSDTDYKLVNIPPALDILLQRVDRHQKSSTRTPGVKKNTASDIDTDSYALHFFFAMLLEGQHAALTMLFTPESAIESSSVAWREIQAQKPKWLHRNPVPILDFCANWKTRLPKIKQQVSKGAEIPWSDLFHGVRTCQEAEELLSTGQITYPRTAASQLLEIKDGKISFDEVVNLITNAADRVTKCQNQSSLPDKPDVVAADELVAELYRQHINESSKSLLTD